MFLDSGGRTAHPRPRCRPPLIDPRHVPIRVTELDLDRPDDVTKPVDRDGTVLALVRLHRHPLGAISVRTAAGDDLPTVLRRAASQELAPALLAHVRADWKLAATGPDWLTPPCLRRRALLLAGDPPPISVIIGTRERPEALARCLRSLARLDYPRYEVLVVDNAPATEATRLTVERAAGPVRYLRQNRRGVASAHNLGVAEAAGRILAFTDDDVVVDRDWLGAVAESFTDPRVGCVTGLIMPAELDTRAQAMLERRGGYAKGFEPRVFEAGRTGDDPLFPFTAGSMGSGANMAFDATVLRRLNGFDPALGPGTVAHAGEDLLALFQAITTGSRVVYQPGAVVWHHHRRDPDALAVQAFGYGVGLGAFLTSALIHEPRLIPAFLRRLPHGTVHALRLSRTDPDDPAAWPELLRALARRGMLRGPAAYAHSRWLARHEPADRGG